MWLQHQGKQLWGSEEGNGKGPEICPGLVWKGSLWYCGSQTEVKLAAGSEIQGLCSSSQH